MHDYLFAGHLDDGIPAALRNSWPDTHEEGPENEDLQRPRKRRKLVLTKAQQEIENERWADHLNLARVTVDLAPYNRVSDQPVLVPSTERKLQVLIKKFDKIGGDKYECEVNEIASGEFIGKLRFASSISELAFQAIRIALSIQKPSKTSSTKAVCTITTVLDEHSESLLRLEVSIIWMNSKSFAYARSDSQNNILAWLVSEAASQKLETWTPRDFYDNVHVPDSNDNSSKILRIDRLECQLYPFQKRAIQWLLSREGVDLRGNTVVKQDSNYPANVLPHGFFSTVDLNGKKCFISPWLGMVTTDEKLLQQPESSICGGILAEEMGLGKTVEIIALICSHRRTIPQENQTAPVNPLRHSSATLIITPPSILQQWKSEIQVHAPSFKIMIYQGIRSANNEKATEEIMGRLLEQDVVLTTYQTLASEIHYAAVTPSRDLRYDKKYERRQSPLVQIDWWRVVLDECQMVESGVSNAARVAQLIPRQNAWAVSGTPLKKDAKDLLGLLIFLRLEPYCLSTKLWSRLVTGYKPTFRQLIRSVALRHTKEQVKGDIQLPPQMRLILTVPFTQIEEQHYSTLYQQMCDDCGLTVEGAPLSDTWNPDSSLIIEKMRSWLTRLRQTCLHPEVGDRNRRALGRGDGPLRTVGEVLQVMIEQNDTAGRVEERTFLLSKLRRGQLLEQADRPKEALKIWLEVLGRSKVIVEECRLELGSSASANPLPNHSEDLEDPTNLRGVLRLRLRSALEVEHTSTFFVANAYFQIKTDEKLTSVDSDRFKELEKMEVETYEKAKVLRNEMLTETHSKADGLMSAIKMKAQSQIFTEIPNFKPLSQSGGIESRNTLARLEDLCDMMNQQAEQLDDWREKMIELLLLPLVDQEDTELQGDEYEISTKQQDEVYVYMEALRALVADRHDALTGQINILIAGEMGTALQQAKSGEGHSPELMQKLLSIRSAVKPKQHLGSIRGIITELRSLKTNLRGLEERGNSRASAEISIINVALQNLQLDAATQAKAVAGLEHELEIFRDTMNARLEYYRQLQTISDAVAPYEEDHDETALRVTLADMESNETRLQARIDTLKSKGRYLLHLRDESTSGEAQRKCIICQEPFDVGALTSCGHSYCKECFRLWWNAHRNCPTCKKRLSRNDLHQITYKPQEMTMQEENQSKSSEAGSDGESPSIYSGINSVTLNQIKNIEVGGSFGTKIDTLARHILWIRENDPGAKSIVFSQFKDFLDVLARAFTKFKIGFASIDKKNGVENFKKDPSIECFFLHAKAHSSGLNLVNATHVFLCEPLINTAIELQAIARVHRIGQHHATTVWMYLVEDTVEKAIYDISVTRRMSHIGRLLEKGAAPELVESDIEAANSLELQEAPLARLMAKGSGGGEMVDKADLWNCLFRQKAVGIVQVSEEAERETTRFLGGSAAEERRSLPTR